MKNRTGYFRKIRQGKIIKPETIWEKNYFIGWSFKAAYGSADKYNMIATLKHLATIIIGENKTPYEERRKVKFYIIKNKKCYVCKTKKADCSHHIILLKNGGFNSYINRIPICNDCHKLIHEWL